MNGSARHDESAREVGSARQIELAANLADLRTRIAQVAAGCGRDPGEITLVVVTKSWPVDDIRRLAQLGVTDVAENRDQEARAKHDACVDLDLRWHFIGGLQRNKCASVARYADLVHSVDHLELVAALDQASARASRDLDVLIQVNLDPESDPESEQRQSRPATGSHRSGVPAAGLAELVDQLAAARHLQVAGVMGVAPSAGDAHAAFARLRGASSQVRATWSEARVISAGMSGDWPEAVAEGATHLRLGSAVLGARAPLR